MAPSLPPVKFATKTQRSSLPSQTRSSSAFATTKKDKRHMKHSNLITKVTKATSASSAAQRNQRRRHRRQLVVNLDALAEALPDDSGTAASAEQANVNVIHRKSIKSRPGALKRRQRIDNGERERFAKNLAEMTGKKTIGAVVDDTKGEVKSVPQTHERWTALKGFISQTMERRPEMSESKS